MLMGIAFPRRDNGVQKAHLCRDYLCESQSDATRMRKGMGNAGVLSATRMPTRCVVY